MDSRVGLAHLCRHTECTRRIGSSYIYPSIHPLAREEDYDLRLDLAQIIQRSLDQDRRCFITSVRMDGWMDAIRGGTVGSKTGKNSFYFEKPNNSENFQVRHWLLPIDYRFRLNKKSNLQAAKSCNWRNSSGDNFSQVSCWLFDAVGAALATTPLLLANTSAPLVVFVLPRNRFLVFVRTWSGPRQLELDWVSESGLEERCDDKHLNIVWHLLTNKSQMVFNSLLWNGQKLETVLTGNI